MPWHRGAGLLLAISLILGLPAIAQAAFSKFLSAALPISAATIGSSTATVSASCSGSGLTITVTNWAIPDPRYVGQFTVTSGGTTLFTGTSDQSGGGTYTAKITPHTGTWNWSVHNEYVVPGTSNVWNGQAKTGQFTCT